MNVDTCSDVPLLRTYSHLLEDEVAALSKRLRELADDIARLRGEEQADLGLEIQLLQIESLLRRGEDEGSVSAGLARQVRCQLRELSEEVGDIPN